MQCEFPSGCYEDRFDGDLNAIGPWSYSTRGILAEAIVSSHVLRRSPLPSRTRNRRFTVISEPARG